MRLPQILIGFFAMTATALCWVHQQVALVTTSYQIAEKERLISELLLSRSNLEYQVLSLESPTHLDRRLKDADRELSFVNPGQVVQVDQPQKESESTKVAKGPLAIWEFLVRSVEARQTTDSHR